MSCGRWHQLWQENTDSFSLCTDLSSVVPYDDQQQLRTFQIMILHVNINLKDD